MNIDFSDDFKARMPTFDDNIRQAVLVFVAHVRQHGLLGLKGRNKSSTPTDPHAKKREPILIMLKNTVFGIIILAYPIMWVSLAT